MKILTAIFVSTLLAGCGVFGEKKVDPPSTLEVMQAGFMDGALAAAKAPLFELTCPASGCVIGSMKIGNPTSTGQLAEIVKVTLAPQRNQWLDVLSTTIGVVGQVGGYAVIGNAAGNIFGKITDGYKAGFASNASIANSGFISNGSIASHIPQPGATTNITQSIGGDGVINGGSLVKSPTTSTTNNTTNISCMFQATTGAGGSGACR